MRLMHSHARVPLTMEITWSRHRISHLERYYAPAFNCWRDIFPGSVFEPLLGRDIRGPVSLDFPSGILVPPHDPGRVMHLPLSRLEKTATPFTAGRYYPLGMVKGLPGVFQGNMTPFLCTQVRGDGITGDLNHPLSRADLGLTLDFDLSGSDTKDRKAGREERGGACTDWLDLALSGPGLQDRAGVSPLFLSMTPPFSRADETRDPVFYTQDRFIHHIDDTAREQVTRFYAGLLRPGDRVLDLMAGWASHLPEKMGLARIHGMGSIPMNSRPTRISPVPRSLTSMRGLPCPWRTTPLMR